MGGTHGDGKGKHPTPEGLNFISFKKIFFIEIDSGFH
jgi:hypothetical protein